jgi:hypothetical protein
VNSREARALYNEYARAMAYVAVRRPDERDDMGSAFHIGEGVFVTALSAANESLPAG